MRSLEYLTLSMDVTAATLGSLEERPMGINRITGQIKTVLLLGTLSAIVVGAGSFAAPSYAWAFAIAGVAMNVGMWFFSDRMVLRTSGARLLEPSEAPDLHAMV